MSKFLRCFGFVFLFLAFLADFTFAADVGVFTGIDCTTLSPVNDQTWCGDNNGNWKVYHAGAWVASGLPPGVAAGTGTLRTDSGTVTATDPKLESYTYTGLPPAGTAGRLARVTDNIRGVWIDTGTVWHSITGWVDTADFVSDLTGATDVSTQFQAAVDAADAFNVPLFVSAGTYAIRNVNIHNYMRISGAAQNGSSVLQTTAGYAALTWTSGTTLTDVEIDHLTFTGNGYAIRSSGTMGGATSPYDYLAASHIHHNVFYASLTEGIYANLILTTIDYNTFGWHGTPTTNNRHIYSKGNVTGNTSNSVVIADNRFYQARTNQSVYASVGFGWWFEHNDWEENAGTSVVDLAGLSDVHFTRLNWFERNDMTYLIVLHTDPGGIIGDYVTEFNGNYVNLNGTGNSYIFEMAGSQSVTFTNNDGTNFNGKYISHWNYPSPAYDTGIAFAWNNHLVAYTGTLTGVHIGHPYSGTVSITGDTRINGLLSIYQGMMFTRVYSWRYTSTGAAESLFPITTGAGGSAYLILVNSHSASETSQTSLYWVSLYYDGTLRSSTAIVGDAQTFTVSGGYLVHTGTAGNTYIISAICISS
jgi:hypothetical protein